MARTFVWHPGKGPRSTDPLPSEGIGTLRIEQVRSEIGHPEKMRRTLRALGLRHHQAVVVHPNSASVRGQIKHVRHLVKVTPVEE
jgi:large subunit ribosomal protein L30